jgi:16S rRNA (guanine(966)-N(2))-methyltransferase RsmD
MAYIPVTKYDLKFNFFVHKNKYKYTKTKRCVILIGEEFFEMRIIAGELKGRRLASPSDNRVRPTTDKVKEAVFSMIAGYLQDSVVLDLFSGTGNLGLEAVSRGAKRAYLVDRDRASIALIRENVQHCKVEDRTVILLSDYAAALRKFNDSADVIFLDPPYKAGYMEECFELIADNNVLADDGIIVAEHSSSETLPDELSGMVLVKSKHYGKISVSIFEKKEAL